MLKRFPRSAAAFAAMLIGVVVMAFAVSTPGWSVDDSIAAPAVYRIALHSVGDGPVAPSTPAHSRTVSPS